MRQNTHRGVAVAALFLIVAVQSSCGGDSASSAPPATNNPPPTATPLARSVALDATTVSLTAAGQTKQLTATVKADSGFAGSLAVTWSSTNPLVATATGGLVVAVGAGTTTITATSVANTSLSASAAVTVTIATPPPPPPPVVDACSPIPVTLGLAVQGTFAPTCNLPGVGIARVYGFSAAKSMVVTATLFPTQSLAVGLDFDRVALAQPAAGGSTVTYAVLLPAGAQRLAVVGSGNFALTVDTTQASMLNAQNCVLLAMPGVSAVATLSRNCGTVDVFLASASGKLVTVVAKHATVTPVVTLVSQPSNAPLGFGTSNEATHTTTLSLLPSSNQFVRIQLLNINTNLLNTVTVTVSQ